MNQSLNFPANVSQLPLVTPAPPPPTPAVKPVVNNNQQASQNPADVTLTSPPAKTKIATSSVQGRPVRPILGKDRSMFERLVDWVVADGPDNRFALICRYCYGHNGMSLAEEYESINFRCCYCYNLNTATNKHRQVHDQLQSQRENPESSKLNGGGANLTKESSADPKEPQGAKEENLGEGEKVDSDGISDKGGKKSEPVDKSRSDQVIKD